MWMLLRHAPVEEKETSVSPSAEYRQVKHAKHEPSIPAFRAGDAGPNPARSTNKVYFELVFERGLVRILF